MLEEPERLKLLHRFMQTRDGWDKIAAAMVQPLMTRFGFHSVGPRFWSGQMPSPDKLAKTSRRVFEITPAGMLRDEPQAAIGKWLREEMDDPMVQAILATSPVKAITSEALAAYLEPLAGALIIPALGLLEGEQDGPALPPISEALLEYKVWTSAVLPENVVLLCRDEPTRYGQGGFHWDNLDLKVVAAGWSADLPPGGLAIDLEVTTIWRSDVPQNVEVFHLTV